VETAAEMTAVMPELHRKPPDVCITPLLPEWNSGRVNAATVTLQRHNGGTPKGTQSKSDWECPSIIVLYGQAENVLPGGGVSQAKTPGVLQAKLTSL
jgi:hypothetical protein